MKKIPTLFRREFHNGKVVKITQEVTEGMEWVLKGEGVATEKIDGVCCAIIGGKFYRRYDAKRGKTPPENAIPCCDPDTVTGHWPHWVPVIDAPENKWFINAYNNTPVKLNCTYEAIGPHFQGNPYGLSDDILEPHGAKIIEIERTFENVRYYLEHSYIEGIVFWRDGEPQCKIKRSDFGFRWPINDEKENDGGRILNS